jgi:glycosyltransferase involved in cell wall biosynthesis
VAVSRFGARRMSRMLGIDPGRIHVVPLGINFDGHPEFIRAEPDIFTIGYLARIAPEKGLHFLCEAYHRLQSAGDSSPSRLWAAGYHPPEHKSYFSDIRKKLAERGHADRFRYHGELNRHEKIEFLGRLSVLSVPTPYEDPKGLFLLEAMASGVPVVQPRRGAFTEIIETTGGGILVEPDDPDALAGGLLEIGRNHDRRRELSERAFRGVREHFGVDRMAEKTVAVYKAVVEGKKKKTVASGQ